ncbi:flagellar filament capping protein FliD [Pseudomonas sp. MWU13-2105]|uniref:flagellar filament capping protein FliD n=1 Tax=Pseudomonas sp. MWU13-2105 TaxID=2935074 RepID=UPI0020103423|nr:flagellar filament capping protein FliD [Pseudomonas sp. MWU13-2105]
MASPITPGTGLGSGLDINSIVTALVNADKSAKQTQITSQTSSNTLKLSGVGSLKSALTTFQTALTNLNSATTPQFPGFSATSGTPSTLTATTNNSAVAGTYNITVNSLATGSKVASASFAGGATSAIPSGTLTISQNGTNYNVTIPANATLQTTRDAINSTLASKGVSANIVTDSNGSRLVFGSTTTGAGSDLTVSGIAGLEIDGTQLMPNPPLATSSGAVSALAKDASLSIDGLTVTSKTNTVSNAISGLTLNLLAASASSTVTVGTNTTGLQTSIQTFVSAYNTLMSTINTLSTATLDANGKPTVSAAFTGDSMPRSLIADIRGALTTPGPGSQLAVLSQLGVGTDQTTGQLNFNSTTFTRAMTTDGLSGQVQQLFTGTTANAGADGLLARMTKAITPYVQTGGLLDQRTNSLKTQATDLGNQQTALDLHVTSLTATLTAKYNAMDLIVGQLKATATSITSFFTSLNAQKSG